ncbi:MAG: DUF6438 domain-containing protein [Alphaproteobacteria bacterium]
MKLKLNAILLAGVALAGCASTVDDPPSEDASVTLRRTVCFGACPAYTVTLHTDGSATFDGDRFVAVMGHRDYRVDPAAVRRLVADFKAAHFFELKDEYRGNVTDLPTVRLTLTIGDNTKTVIDYAGEMAGMPKAVRKLELEVDEVGETEQFVRKTAPAS